MDGMKELYKLMGKYQASNRIGTAPVDSSDFYLLLEIVSGLAQATLKKGNPNE